MFGKLFLLLSGIAGIYLFFDGEELYDCHINNVGGYPNFRADSVSKHIFDNGDESSVIVKGFSIEDLEDDGFYSLSTDDAAHWYGKENLSEAEKVYRRVVSDGCGNTYWLTIAVPENGKLMNGFKWCAICM